MPRQRRYFFYMTGCKLSDCYFLYDMDSSHSTLFIPPLDPESVMWSGLPVSAAEALEMFDVDEVKYTTDVNIKLASRGAEKKATVFAIPNQVSDHVTFLEFDDKNFSVLKDAIETARVVKDEYELALMKKANDISSSAHKGVMAKVRGAENEQQLEASFVALSIAEGAKHQSYHPISASGRSAATLHYVKNNQPLAGKLNLLLDAGAEWDCYASDIVRCPPLSLCSPAALSLEARSCPAWVRSTPFSLLPCRLGRSPSRAGFPRNPEKSMTLYSKCSSSVSLCSDRKSSGTTSTIMPTRLPLMVSLLSAS